MNTENPQDDVLYIGRTFAVVRKRIGEICENVSKPDSGLSLLDRIKPAIEARLKAPCPFLEAVNRLDQPVEGGVIVAFDKDVFTELSHQFVDGLIRKRYLAVVEKTGKPLNDKSGTLVDWILFDKKSRKSWIVPEIDAKKRGAKRAVLDWSLVGEGDRYLFLSVEPKTGRTHQIRAQLSAFGYPIKGDLKYGAKRSEPGGGIRLHAQTVQFRSPDTGDVLTINCDITAPDPLWTAFLSNLNA